jgi:hypothetical protein
MKKIIVIAAIVGMFGGIAHAGGASAGNIAVMESSVTVVQVSIASGTAVDILTTALTMPDRTTLVIQNVDATYDIYCGGQGVTATTGFLVAAGGGSISLNVRPYSAKLESVIRFFCISASTAGATKAAIIQGY